MSSLYIMMMMIGACVLSVLLTLATPWTVIHQAPLATGFPRQPSDMQMYWETWKRFLLLLLLFVVVLVTNCA